MVKENLKEERIVERLNLLLIIFLSKPLLAPPLQRPESSLISTALVAKNEALAALSDASLLPKGRRR